MRWASMVVILGVLGGSGVVWADEAPISGTVKSVDADANTIMLEATVRGKTRQVTVYLKPGAKIVKFARATEPGKTGFVEQAISPSAARLTNSIVYHLPRSAFWRIVGLLVARPYRRWCRRRMVQDARHALEAPARVTS